MIEFKNVSKTYAQSAKVLDGISARINYREVVAVIGPSGSGKSTLLRTINGLESISGGTINLEAKRTAMVFQSFELFPHLTVIDNLTLAPMRAQGVKRAEAEKDARKWLQSVHLEGFESRFPGELSGGQQQRVAIARALCINPEVLLLDEPTASLDRELVAEVLGVIEDLRGLGLTIIIVSHELEFLRKATDRVLFLDAGKILEDRATEEFFAHPSTFRAQEFLSAH